MNSLSPRLGVLAGLVVLLLPSPVRADAGSELDSAFEKLRQTTYRKREIIVGAAAMGGCGPVVTEYGHGCSRMVTESDMPMVGRIRQERVTVGRRSAVRTIAPGVTGRLDDARRAAAAQSARGVMQQIAAVGGAVATGGLSTVSVVKSAVAAAAAVHGGLRAQQALGQASAAYDSWQLISEDDEPTEPDGLVPASTGAGARVDRSAGANGRTIRYTRRFADDGPGGDVVTIVDVDSRTGLPVAEETIVNGQCMTRCEYFDAGAAITIEIPPALR